MPRTPIALNHPEPAGAVVKNTLNLDDSLEIAAEVYEAPPSRGAITSELKELEEKVENIKFDDDEKEEGEITHDSDADDENDENALIVLSKTPLGLKNKTSLESDCRSPLLIENDEPVFEKVLTNELAAMAAKNAAAIRKPLGVKSENVKSSLEPAHDDSLVI